MKVMLIGAASSNHTKRWAKALIDRGHQVLLVTCLNQKDDMNDLSSEVAVKYLKFPGKSYYYYLNVISARKIFKEFKPDIVNVQYASGYGTMARLARLKPLVISVFGSDVYDFPYLNKFNYWVIRKNLRYANAIASTSIAMAQQVKKILNKNIDVTVTPFGVDTRKFIPINSKPSSRPIVGIVKYLEPIYDIQLLIRAFAIVHSKESVKPLLHIYGGGTLLEELKALCVKLNISDDVCFYGTVPNNQIPAVLNSFDVFVNCSITESFGVAIVEAMSCGLPVVATDAPGFKEVVDDRISGIILRDREPETMAIEIAKLLHDKKKCEEMGKNGRQKVLKEYDWEKNINTMENLFKSLVDKI
ncbi:glycosyltransferase family 4 protein [Parabacteroides sp. AF17-3]|uniref:glycosyltransferase n=1 Tax=Parabacteroides sp. AF17-3 TaxID=2293113 RepID=UPI000EFE5300|nr:glycosyltransferase [Parabacteroides sp. AF17-3]RKU66291.1 glycosyltransferase family 4 protein [Parabacteroides sp. AF17-3]